MSSGSPRRDWMLLLLLQATNRGPSSGKPALHRRSRSLSVRRAAESGRKNCRTTARLSPTAAVGITFLPTRRSLCRHQQAVFAPIGLTSARFRDKCRISPERAACGNQWPKPAVRLLTPRHRRSREPRCSWLPVLGSRTARQLMKALRRGSHRRSPMLYHDSFEEGHHVHH